MHVTYSLLKETGWDGEGGGREVQGGGAYVYLWLIHVDASQKPTL